MATSVIQNQTHQCNTMLGPVVVGGTTVQIPNFSALSEDKAVIICMHRYSYLGSISIPVKAIRSGDAAGGSTVYMQSITKYCVIKVSSSGVITLATNNIDGDPYVDIIVI